MAKPTLLIHFSWTDKLNKLQDTNILKLSEDFYFSSYKSYKGETLRRTE